MNARERERDTERLRGFVGQPIAVVDLRNREEVTGVLLDVSATFLSVKFMGGGYDFRRSSGSGVGEVKHWRIAERSVRELGLVFGKPSAFQRRWVASRGLNFGHAPDGKA